ncbi:MAG: redoxin domain-containing protein [Alphaproteobacteria bacterium]|jgi:glutathione peroxidase
MKIYDFSVLKPDGSYQPLADFQGKTVLLVNTASKCGFTKQYAGLQKLYEKYRDRGFTVLAFPCNQFLRQEPGTDEEIQTFCRVNYGVTFPVYAKLDVRGKNQHPLYSYLTRDSGEGFKGMIRWNFTKFLIDPSGNIIRRYAPTTTPEEIEPDLQELMGE